MRAPTYGSDLWPGWEGVNATKVVVGQPQGQGEFTIVLTLDGRLFSFGDCRSGTLGVAAEFCSVDNCAAVDSCQKTPQLVDFSAYESETWFPPTIVDVAAGEKFAVALASNGLVFAWGDGYYNGIANGCCTLASGCAGCTTYYTPVLASGLNGAALGNSLPVAIAAGPNFLFVTTDAGGVWVVGTNAKGQLGL
ncbi:regulator of chromosome condensation 1/beta-lactamase-inhibitor protein II, partial [Baffinella frigidus]